MQFLSSAQNPQIKRLKGVQEKAKKRKEEGLFCIEGEKEIRHALKGGIKLNALFVREGYANKIEAAIVSKTELIEVDKSLFESLCFRKKTTQWIGLASTKTHALSQLDLAKKEVCILVAQAIEKPGNIGALLRTADAMAVDALLIANPKTDLYNPNVVRSSVGCLFTVAVGVGTTKEIQDFLDKNKVKIFSAALSQKAKPYTTVDFKGRIAIAVGTEDKGLSQEWLTKNTEEIYIPMRGENDSLNVSVAAGILLSEACRQRN
ncbi:MAG: TrmH family RNA methyltransferase [Flavobacteriaceae bacterium]